MEWKPQYVAGEGGGNSGCAVVLVVATRCGRVGFRVVRAASRQAGACCLRAARYAAHEKHVVLLLLLLYHCFACAGVPANPVALLQICYAVAPAAAAAPQQPVPAATAAAAALPAVPALPAAAVPQSSSASATAPAAAGNGAADEQRVPAGSEATAAAGAAAGAVGAGGGAAGSSATAAAMGQSGVQEQRALHPSFEGTACVLAWRGVAWRGSPQYSILTPSCWASLSILHAGGILPCVRADVSQPPTANLLLRAS